MRSVIFGPRRDLGGQRALDREGAVDGIDDAGEFDQRAIADQLDDAAIVFGDGGVENCLAVTLQRRQRAGLVGRHHARIGDDIGRQNRGKPADIARLSHGAVLLLCGRRRQPGEGARQRPAHHGNKRREQTAGPGVLWA